MCQKCGKGLKLSDRKQEEEGKKVSPFRSKLYRGLQQMFFRVYTSVRKKVFEKINKVLIKPIVKTSTAHSYT